MRPKSCPWGKVLLLSSPTDFTCLLSYRMGWDTQPSAKGATDVGLLHVTPFIRSVPSLATSTKLCFSGNLSITLRFSNVAAESPLSLSAGSAVRSPSFVPTLSVCAFSGSLAVLQWRLGAWVPGHGAQLSPAVSSRDLTGPSSYNPCCPLSKSSCCQMKRWWSMASPTCRTSKTSSTPSQPGEAQGRSPEGPLSMPLPCPLPHSCSSQERAPQSLEE